MSGTLWLAFQGLPCTKSNQSEGDISDKFIVTRVAQLRRLCADLRQRLSASQSTQAHLAEALVKEFV